MLIKIGPLNAGKSFLKTDCDDDDDHIDNKTCCYNNNNQNSRCMCVCVYTHMPVFRVLCAHV
jgi:hypothetical protein